MRIERLDLRRYGCFADRAVDLPDAPLTVVLGANEAGKSTALAALGDALFGVPEKSPQDWLARRSGEEVRVGATLVAADGRRLAFLRRKARVRTLVAPDGAPLPDDALAPFLGGCSRAQFRALHGLDQTALREGGLALVEGEGDLGESLLAAAAVVRGAARLRRELEAEAEALYAPRAAKGRAFYAALAAFEAARADAVAATVTRPRYEEAADAERAAETRFAEAGARLEALIAADRRDHRLRAALPILRDLDAALAERAMLADLDAAPADAAGALADAIAAVARAADAARRHAATLEALDERRRRAAAPSPLLAHAETVRGLVRRIGEHESGERSLPLDEAALRDLDADLADRARRLGVTPDEFDHLGVDDPTLAAARAALGRGATLAGALEEARRRLDEAEAALAALPEPAEEPDPGLLRARLERLRAAPQLEADAAAAADDAGDAARRAAAARAALAPGLPDGVATTAFRLPAEEDERREGAAIDRIAERRRALAGRRDRLDAERAAAAAEAALAAPAAPDRAALLDARAARDAAWTAIRRARLDGGGGPSPAPEVYEGLVAAADDLADRREAAAEALARAAAAAGRLAACDAEAAALDAAEAALAAEEAEATGRWRALWRGLDGEPLSPEGMRAWRLALDRARELDLVAAAEAGRAARAGAAAAVARDGLAALAAALGAPVETPLAALVETLDRRIGDAEKRREALERRRQAVAERDRRAAERRQAACAVSRWRSAWEELARRAGVDPGLDAEGARAALDLIAEAPGRRHARADLVRRIDARRAALAAFETEVEALRAAAAPDLPPGAPRALAQALEDRLREDAARARDLDGLAREAEALAAEGRRVEADVETAGAALAAALARAGAPAAPDPGALLDRLRRRDALDAQIAAERRRLAEQAGEETEAALRAALAGESADGLAARLLARETELHAAREAHAAAAAEREAARAAFAALLAGPDPALARQRMRDATAAMTAAAEEWATLETARHMLTLAAGAYAEANRGPVLARAEALFRAITGGAFEGLAAAMDEDADRERLVAVRRGGERVRADVLSEGTRDQLFLALRLAAVERRAAEREPLPIVADDLFASFDDARTEAGLAALAAVGRSAQALVFTHHRAVADAAARLGAPVVAL